MGHLVSKLVEYYKKYFARRKRLSEGALRYEQKVTVWQQGKGQSNSKNTEWDENNTGGEYMATAE